MSKPFSNILIVSDYDGTFAGKNIDKNREAVKRFISLGGHFTFASGRSADQMKEFISGLYDIVNAPLLTVNGAVLYDLCSEKVLSEMTFSLETARSITSDVLAKFPSAYVYFSDPLTPRMKAIPDDYPHDTIRMMSFQSGEEIIDEILGYVRNEYGSVFSACHPYKTIIDLTAKGVTKGLRIEFLRKHFANLGVKDLKVACIGDFENDISMLEAADIAFCPENAIYGVKNICDHIVCHHDEGAIADMVNIIEEKYI